MKALSRSSFQILLTVSDLVYELIDESGPAHAKSFTIAVRIDDVVYGKGTAGSKKEACQLAAKEALEKLAKKV